MGQRNTKINNISLHRYHHTRRLPNEILDQIFASLPLSNAFRLLAKLPNKLLARTVGKMLDKFKMALEANKWNLVDCGLFLEISKDGLVVVHSGPYGWNCVRAIVPIPSFNMASNKATIAFYFEVEILNNSSRTWNYGIDIGFCCHEFPLMHDYLGNGINSIGIWNKSGIWIEGNVFNFEHPNEWFREGEVVGLGIVHQPDSKMECFATWNGDLLGKVELPPNFANIQLFPAVDFFDAGDSIRANFKGKECCFKEFNKVLQ